MQLLSLLFPLIQVAKKQCMYSIDTLTLNYSNTWEWYGKVGGDKESCSKKLGELNY